MKRKQFLALILISFVSFVVLPDTFAQDYTWLNLPQEAKHRLGKGRITDMAYAPDGNQLAVSTNIGIWIYDARTGNALNTLLGQTNVNGIAYSPDGRTLVSGSSNSKDTIRLWDTTTGDHKATFREQAFGAYSIAFSPDGKTLASGTEYSSQVGVLWLWNTTTGKYKAGKSGFQGSVNFGFSPDGQTLATQTKMGQQVMLWDAATGVVRTTFPWHSGSFSNFAFSPDGQTLATGTGDGFIFLWELTPDILQPSRDTSVLLPPLPADPPQIRLIYFAPNDHTHQPNMDTELQRTAYWDGRNEFGESITSGVYFYTLTTSDFNATRKMLIQK